MNWDQIEGNWKQIKGRAKQQWGKLTNDDLDQLAGKRDQLIGKIQERYGYQRDQAEARGRHRGARLVTSETADLWFPSYVTHSGS
jgi:uncharacterized protein YjbJ (UPF0337 family)